LYWPLVKLILIAFRGWQRAGLSRARAQLADEVPLLL